jgi:phosphatidyl-myo-inositol dimannoside synthase
MKILLVGNYFYPEHTGGVETVSYNLVKHYRESGHEVRWVAADVLPRLRNAGKDDVPIRAWNITEEKFGFPQPIPYPEVFYKLYNTIHWCDIVHLQDCLYLINIVTFIIAKLLHKPVLLTQYAKFIPYTQFYKRVLQIIGYQTIGRLMFTTASKVVFITKNVRDNMQYINPARMQEIVHLGVDTDFYSPLPGSERIRLREELTGNSNIPIILFVGRMVERKGVHLVQPLIAKYQEWHWVLVGRPDDFNPGEWDYSNLTYINSASEQQLKELYCSADLLLHPSVGEGVTLIVSESLAVGTPVVISQESLYEVDDKDLELFFAVQPEVKVIEESLIHALADQQRLDNLRIRSRQYALDRLSWKKMTDRYLSILNELLAQK